MECDVDYSLIPEHMRPGVKRYLENGRRPGSFLTAVLENNLVESFARADNINQSQMLVWVNFLYNEMPMASWGSKEKVKAWVKKKKEETNEK